MTSMQIIEYLNLELDAYGAARIPHEEQTPDQRMLRRGVFKPVNKKILDGIIEAAQADLCVAILQGLSPALKRDLICPFNYIPERGDRSSNYEVAFLLWVCNPAKIVLGKRTKNYNPEAAQQEINEMQQELGRLASLSPYETNSEEVIPKDKQVESEVIDNTNSREEAFEALDAEAFNLDDFLDAAPVEQFESDEEIPIDEFITRHRTDILDATREIGGLSNHSSTSVIGVAMLKNGMLGIVTKYAMPTVVIKYLIDIHYHEIVQMYHNREFDRFGLDARGLQLVTSKPKQAAFDNHIFNQIQLADRQVILPVIISMQTDRTLGIAAFNGMAFGVIMPFSYNQINKLGLSTQIDISKMVLGPSFDVYEFAWQDEEIIVDGKKVIRKKSKLMAEVIARIGVTTVFKTNIRDLPQQERDLWGALVAIPLANIMGYF